MAFSLRHALAVSTEAGMVTRKNSMARRTSTALREGRNVSSSGYAPLSWRTGSRSAGEPSHVLPAGTRSVDGIVPTPIRLPGPILVPPGTRAALPMKERSPTSVGAKAMRSAAKAATPIPAMSATKLPSPRVSRSGSTCDMVDTSAPRPMRAPSSRSQGAV
ncbi:hypothetical protein [Streptomyces sp. Wh19]|uniref:hypothetical protein n=1 Tax=Streptomyces sp. Wh19 TaxID=3076629 RepID=UPI0029586769|nr:hypothetical protein [Streptomyces sp. Wh19]MDV9201958.1 hypothetical protein [Streptomyces sp. Wh19]